jgi:hypothetical protein
MKRNITPKRFASPAMAVALLSLIVGLTGVSYAALKLKPNSVGAKQLKKDAVKNAKIADAAVGQTEIADGAVNSAKVADGTLTRADAGRGALVTAYARINNGAGASSVASGTAVNVIDTDDLGADGTGNVIVTFNPSALPGGSIAACSISVQPISLSNVGGITNLNAAVAVNSGGFLNADEAQVQTFNAAGGAADLDFFVQANCPPS